jgi:two-component sensor histidine kinase
MDGYILYFFPGANLTFLYSFLPSLTMVVSSLYAVRFLEVKNYAPDIYRLSKAVILYFTLYLLFHFLLPQSVMLVLNQVNAVISLLFMFSLGITTGRKGNKVGYYFAGAYFTYLLIVIVEVVYIQTGTPRYLFGLSHVSIAIMIEAIILAYLLSKKFNWEKEEMQLARQEAQTLLLKKTQENEQIVRDQNIRLEETVRQRTLEISHQKELVEKTLTEIEGLLHEKEVLLKEIHHRVKNNLQTISSILMVQGAGLKDEQAKKAIAESQRRVSSIALVHQKLYQTDGLEKVELKGFIQELCEQVKSFYSDQSTILSINLDVAETLILIDTAIPLGLMLNELLTNSFKYAFSNTDKGVITIKFLETDFNQALKRKTYLLTYSDNGPGLASEEMLNNSTTLGLRLIKLLSRQISANMQYQNSGSSSEFSFVFSITV